MSCLAAGPELGAHAFLGSRRHAGTHREAAFALEGGHRSQDEHQANQRAPARVTGNHIAVSGVQQTSATTLEMRHGNAQRTKRCRLVARARHRWLQRGPLVIGADIVVGGDLVGADILGVTDIVGSDLVGFTVRDTRRCRGTGLLA
jgi:hypothetical protein